MSASPVLFLAVPLAVLAMEAPSLTAKVLLADIVCMYKNTGKVYTSDDHYAERYNMGKRTIGEAMKWLETEGWLMRDFDYSARTKRALSPTQKALSLFEKSMRNPHEVNADSAWSNGGKRMKSMRNPQGVDAESADKENKGKEQLKKEANASGAGEQDSVLNSDGGVTFNDWQQWYSANLGQHGISQAPAHFCTFAIFWDAYGKKVDAKKCRAKWEKLPLTTRQKALARLPAYVAATPNSKFRKDPQTWLNGENWNDEDLPPTTDTQAAGNTPTIAPHSLIEKLRAQQQKLL